MFFSKQRWSTHRGMIHIFLFMCVLDRVGRVLARCGACAREYGFMLYGTRCLKYEGF